MMKSIKTVGIVGAGTMGSALAQKFAQEDFKVILADRETKYVEKGLENIKNMLNEGVQRKVFMPEQVKTVLSNIKGTINLEDLKTCDLVIEAIFENLEAKTELFKTLSNVVGKETILATNTSSFSVTQLAESVLYPERFIGLHYFYHAAKNRLVEIIPGKETSEKTYQAVKIFSMQSGKDAITCRDVNGFVVNRFFVPWLNEAVRIYEEGLASKEIIDKVCMKVFGIGMGPFELMNATGVPVAYHAEKTLEVFGNVYKVADALKKQAEINQLWEIGDIKNTVVSDETAKIIKERMQGIVFYVSSQLLEEKVCSATDIDRGSKIGLRWKKGPVELMKQAGQDEVMRLIVQVVDTYNVMLPDAIGNKYWQLEYVRLETKNDNKIAVIIMDQPENMNALNEEVMVQLHEKIGKANADPVIETIYITGSGKAFVAGADIKFFVNNIKSHNIPNIISFTRFGQKVFEEIENSPKKVVTVLNGMALGGGLELALCADVILATPKAVMAFPETGIGIYPGLGGTQRSTKKIGKGLAKYLIYTGKILNASDAEEIGLVDKIIQTDDMFALFEGKIPIPETTPKKAPGAKWIALNNLYEKNSLESIFQGKFTDGGLSAEEIDKLRKTMGQKAPVALKIAEKLINKAGGCATELDELGTIFSTSDALLGLTSIGQKVEYRGK